MLPIGSKAPDFKLRLDSGELFRLRNLFGKNNLVISFYPDDISVSEKNDTYIFLQQLQKAQSLGAQVLAISPHEMEELRKLLTLYDFSLPIASDPTLEVCRNYRVIWLRGMALRRLTYIIDKNGIIRGCLCHHLNTKKPWEYVMHLLKELNTEQLRS